MRGGYLIMWHRPAAAAASAIQGVSGAFAVRRSHGGAQRQRRGSGPYGGADYHPRRGYGVSDGPPRSATTTCRLTQGSSARAENTDFF